MDITNLKSFLKLGYYLDYKSKNIPIDLSHIDKLKYNNNTEDSLIEKGISIWRESIEKRFSSQREHVVPISGGIDSRAILAALLENTQAEDIHTFTFGEKGTYDYEIGNKIARTLGTKHKSFSLTDQTYTLDELITTSKRFDNQTLLFYHPCISKICNLYKNMDCWSGYLGDPLAGSHLPLKPTNNIKEANLHNLDDLSKFIL